MAELNTDGGTLKGAAVLSTDYQWSGWPRTLLAGGVLAVLLAIAYFLHITPERGAAASYSLLTGAAIGIVFQRGRFCFYCILTDFFNEKNSGPLYAILTALAVGGIGYAIVFGAFMPNPMSGRMPPGAHIGPVSWVLLAAGIAFGLGMTLSGACISGHLYRLGEGYSRAPLALMGSLVGFGLGFYTWQRLYVSTIAKAPVPWLPNWLGYSGAVAVHLLVLGALAWLLLRRLPAQPAQPATVYNLAWLHRVVLGQRWHPFITGALVGLIGIFAYFRVEPLGVTAQLGSISRTAMHDAGLLGDRLFGLDTFAGCATAVIHTITNNGLLISGLVFAAFAAALLSNKFEISRLTPGNSATALLGGVLMGWGSMTALGCTVGTLLSGISAFALSGWIFAAAVLFGVWIGLKARLDAA